MNDKVKCALNGILKQFRTGDLPEAVAFLMFEAPNIPSRSWSLINRTIMFLADTYDGRGYRQWQQVGRYVKKGSKAFYILVPFIKKVEDEQGKESQRLFGFGCKPVFRLEDTDGEPMEYDQVQIPELPLMERAEEWGISVKCIPGNYSYYGFYSPAKSQIALATPEEKVFFHELSHVAHEKVKRQQLKSGQDPLQEIVAELSAAALCKMVGKQSNDTSGNSYKYIGRYASKLKMSPYMACVKVMSETEKVLRLILTGTMTMSSEALKH